MTNRFIYIILIFKNLELFQPLDPNLYTYGNEQISTILSEYPIKVDPLHGALIRAPSDSRSPPHDLQESQRGPTSRSGNKVQGNRSLWGMGTMPAGTKAWDTSSSKGTRLPLPGSCSPRRKPFWIAIPKKENHNRERIKSAGAEVVPISLP